MRLQRSAFAVVAFACASAPFVRAAAAPPGQAEVRTATNPIPPTPAPTGHDGRPSITLDEFLEGRRHAIDKVLDAQIARLRRLLALTSDDDPQKPDLWFRLGDLCDEKRRAAFAEAQALEHATPNPDP
jgi:hypothetical protein